jgi:phosphoadenosine phosphosulfate reductase
VRVVSVWHPAEGSAQEPKTAQELLAWALDRFPAGRLALASSFGAEDVVLIDLFAELGRFPRVITLDTGRLPPQTYEVIERVRRRYGLPVELRCPDAAELEDMQARHGPNLFYESVSLRRECCRVRKIEPLKRALAGCEAWVTGLRREQSATRARVAKASWDAEFGLVKLSPLAEWTDADVWRRVREREIPYNALHDEGYPSIGCAPCTRAVKPGEDARSGRWWWESADAHKECGLHRAQKEK